MAVDHNNPQSRTEEILIATIDGEEYNKIPQSRLEELLLELKQVIEEGGGSGGTTNYNNLSNLPQINNITLKGNKSAADLSLVLAEVGKGLSANDYSNEEKAKVANLLTAIEGILTGSDIDSFGDVETALSAIKDGTELDSFGDVESALGEKADTDIVASDFSTATSYTTGDYCIYEGKFYKFKANHSGAWSVSDVDEIKIAGELSTLKSGLTNVESNLDDVVVEYTGPAHSSDGRYYYFYFPSPFQSTCNRIFFDITYGSQHGYPKNAICMYNTDGSTTAWVNTDDTNITNALSDGELVITVDCGASAWVIPVLRIKKKYGDLLTIR